MDNKIDLYVRGEIKDGKVLMTCGNDLCLADLPKQVLPPVPKVKEGQRVILSVKNGAPFWKVRDPSARNAAIASGGVNLATIVAVIFIVKRLIKSWDKER